MKDKKFIVLAVILLALVGYYVWYANKTKIVEPPVKAVDIAKINPDIALARKVNIAIDAYKKDKGSVPKSLDELKGQYLDQATLQNVVARGFEYEYVGPQAYRLRTSKAGAPVKVAAKKPPSKTQPTGATSSSGSTTTTGSSLTITTRTGWKYDPMGKPDPFKPFILAKVQEEVGSRERQRILTPLQKMPLSEIQSGLKAIVWGQLGNKALVEDATGKGYVVKEGTYVGQNDGIVKKIYEDRIVVEEYRRDPARNQLQPREVVLKLKKVEAEQ